MKSVTVSSSRGAIVCSDAATTAVATTGVAAEAVPTGAGTACGVAGLVIGSGGAAATAGTTATEDVARAGTATRPAVTMPSTIGSQSPPASAPSASTANSAGTSSTRSVHVETPTPEMRVAPTVTSKSPRTSTRTRPAVA